MSVIKRCMLRWCTHEIRVRRIGKGWNVRLFTNGELNQEIRVYRKLDIGTAARTMLRLEDKCGNWSKFAMAARKRMWDQEKYPQPYIPNMEHIAVVDFKL